VDRERNAIKQILAGFFCLWLRNINVVYSFDCRDDDIALPHQNMQKYGQKG
jgi:hypothetical protein